MKRKTTFLLVMLCGGLLMGLRGPSWAQNWIGHPVKANDFLNTMGVCTHHIQELNQRQPSKRDFGTPVFATFAKMERKTPR